MKKGFTLIELLAVIAILAIIMLIAAPSVLDTIEESKINAYKADEKMMSKAAETYLSANQNLIPEDTYDSKIIQLADLKNDKLINDFGNENCDGHVLIKKNEDGFKYLPYLKCNDYISQNPSDEGLVLDMPLGDYKTEGNYGDRLGNSSGIDNGSTLTSDRFGNTNKACQFDGIDQNIRILNSDSFNLTGQITISLWVYWTGNLSEMNFITKEQSYEIGILNGKIMYATNPWSWRGLELIDSNAWHQIVYTTDINGYQKFYVDSVLKYESAGLLILNNTNYITLAARTDGTYRNFDGKLDDVKIYNRALTEEEIAHNYSIEKNISL